MVWVVGCLVTAWLLGATRCPAQDRVIVTEADQSVTLKNQFMRIVIDCAGPAIARIDRVDERGQVIPVSGGAASFAGGAGKHEKSALPPVFRHAVVRFDDGSVTVAMRQWWGATERVMTYLHMRPDVAAVTWTGRAENLSTHETAGNLAWIFAAPDDDKSQRSADDVPGWYWPASDTNVLLTCEPMRANHTFRRQHHDWLAGRFAALPAYGAVSQSITIAVVSGIGPASAASDTLAISKVKDDGGQWMIAVAPYGRLIDSHITVTAGLKSYKQTVNAGPRLPFVVQTPLTEDKIEVTLRSSKDRMLLRYPAADNIEAGKADVDQISERHVARMADALKAMAEQRWADASKLAQAGDDDVLWMKLIGALAEQGAGHEDAAKNLLTRIVEADPAAAEAWWLLGEKERAKQLADEAQITATLDALRQGRVPVTK